MSSSCVLFAVKNSQEVYTFVKQNLEVGNKVTYLTTSSKADLIASISRNWSGVGRYIVAGHLSVRSAFKLFPIDAGHDVVVSKNTRNTISAEPLNSASYATVVICPGAITAYAKTCPPTSHLASKSAVSQVNRIIEFEASVSKQFSNGSVVCCVFDQLVRGLDLVPLLNLMKYHTCVIGHSGQIIPLLDLYFLDAIKRGIDVTMGEGFSTLLLKTLQYVYNVDERTILRKPVVWSNMLKKVCGERAANQILNAVTEEIRKLVLQ